MFTEQRLFTGTKWQIISKSMNNSSDSDLVLVFGSPELITANNFYDLLKIDYPLADIIICSTAGEICDTSFYDNTVSVTAIKFEKTKVKSVSTNIKEHTNSYQTGLFLRKAFSNNELQAIFVISDGTLINGSELVAGLNEANTTGVLITGGLAGDGAKFEKTFTSLNAQPAAGNIIAIGFYGSQIRFGHGSLGGWDEFGPQKTITKADKNILYEVDNRSALDLYKDYLGPFREELPGSALLFPISLSEPASDKKVVRTILSIDENNKSMTFAGNMPRGCKVRLMKAHFDKLIDASATAAQNTLSAINEQPDIAILISCIGRKLILQDRTSEEVNAAKEKLGAGTVITGFYSYGEISPLQNTSERCELHNQTMTITTIKEI